MTAPAVDAQGRADSLAGRLRALTASTVGETSGPLRDRLDEALRDLTGWWVRLFGSIADKPTDLAEASRFSGVAVARIRRVLDPAELGSGAFERAWLAAYAMGTDHAVDTAPFLPPSLPVRDRADVPDLSRPVAEALARAVSALSEVALTGFGFGSVTVAVAEGRTAARRIDSTVAFELTAAATAGVRDMAAVTGSAVVWVAERDGCLTCLAYSGETTTDLFPLGLTFSDRALTPPGPLVGPPMHPACRCSLQLFAARDQAVADGLKREAKRSVLRGWADDGESEPEKLRAASRLLDTAHGMPASVERVASRALRDGGFTK